MDSQEEVLVEQALVDSKPSHSGENTLSEDAERITGEHSYPYIETRAATSNCKHRDTSKATAEERPPPLVDQT